LSNKKIKTNTENWQEYWASQFRSIYIVGNYGFFLLHICIAKRKTCLSTQIDKIDYDPRRKDFPNLFVNHKNKIKKESK